MGPTNERPLSEPRRTLVGEATKPASPTDMPFRALGTFFGLAFTLTWGIAALLILFPEPVEAVFGPLGYTNPLFILAVYAPGLAGLFLVWRHFGLAGVGSFLRRLAMWRISPAWWGFLLLGIPALNYLGAAMTGTITDPFPFSPWTGVLPALAITLAIGPMEEFGWRGVALPLLQRRYAPLWAGSILGVIWILWHVPAFLLSGTPQSAWAFAPFFIGGVAISIIMTAAFNASRGSILIAVLFHFQINNPIWPDALPWAALTFSLAAIVVVWLNRKAMLSRTGAATEILMAPAGGRPGSAEGT
jgi:uncharacterized protein